MLAGMNTVARYLAISIAILATIARSEAQTEESKDIPTLAELEALGEAADAAELGAEIAALAKDGETAQTAAELAGYYSNFAQRFHDEVRESDAARSGQRVLRAISAADRAERFATRANE